MKRFLLPAIIALLVLVPVGVVLAAKTAKTKNAAATKATHRSSKKKAANEKLIQEMLTILEETENKATFAACLECLTQLKPPREVVVPAIIRKADKMGWLRPDGADDWTMIGEYVSQLLPSNQRKVKADQSAGFPYTIQCSPPLPSAAFVQNHSVPQPMPAPNFQSFPILMAPGYAPPAPPAPAPPAPPICPPAPYGTAAIFPHPMPMPTIMPMPTLAPCVERVMVAIEQTPPTDRLTAELLKILNETESKVTFALVVETSAGRDENWDIIIPTVIRKADKMGWLKVPNGDKDFGEKFTENLAELLANKVAQAGKGTATPAEAGCGSCPHAKNAALSCNELFIQPFISGVIGDVEELPMPHNSEMLPMPHCDTEVLSMPHDSVWMRYIGGSR